MSSGCGLERYNDMISAKREGDEERWVLLRSERYYNESEEMKR